MPGTAVTPNSSPASCSNYGKTGVPLREGTSGCKVLSYQAVSLLTIFPHTILVDTFVGVKWPLNISQISARSLPVRLSVPVEFEAGLVVGNLVVLGNHGGRVRIAAIAH